MDSQQNYDRFFEICEDIIDSSLNHNDNIENQEENLCEEVIHDDQFGGGFSRYEVVQDRENHVRRFGIRGRLLTFRLSDPPSQTNPIEWFQESIQQV